MADERIEVVRAGYDAMAADYLTWAGTIEDPMRLSLLSRLDDSLADGSEVLDLGCGAGVPCTQRLAERHSVLGVDVSAAQIALARGHVPAARFEQHDLTSLEVPAASLDAVTAFYSLTHVPRDRHADLLVRIRSWLRPGGWLLATLSASGTSDGIQDDFVGVPMYFSGFDADTNRRLVRDAGFDLVVDEVALVHEPEGDARFLWVLARAA